MLEVEMKFPIGDFAALEARLRAWSAHPMPPVTEADHYHNAPDRDFARTDEALRLRRVDAENRVTYKGPRLTTATKTRVEVEVPLAPGDDAAADFLRLLGFLKYRPTLVVRKVRRVWHLDRNGFALEVCLDEVEGLGRFVELEILAPAERLDAAQAVLLAVAADLGLGVSERRSYLELLLAKADAP